MVDAVAPPAAPQAAPYTPPVVQMWQQHYSDMPFADFAKKLYESHYSDMPFEEFAAKSQIIPVDNHGMGTRAQREPDQITTSGGQQVNTIPYATGMADAIQQNSAGDAGAEGAMSIVPGFNKVGSAIDSGLSQVGINGPGVSGPISYEDRLSQVRGAGDANDAMHPTARMIGKGVGIGTTALIAPSVLPETLGTIGSGAATGALYSGLSGGIEQDGSLADKLKTGAIDAGIGGVAGGALGGVASGLGAAWNAGKGFIAPTAGGAAGQSAIEAGQRLIDAGALKKQIPVIAASDSPALQRGGQMVAGTIFGGPARKGILGGQEDLGAAVKNTAAQVGTAAEPAVTGANLHNAISDSVKNIAPAKIDAESKSLDGIVPDSAAVPSQVALGPLHETAGKIISARQAAGKDDIGGALGEVTGLLQRPDVTIAGLRRARSDIGDVINGNVGAPTNYNKGEYKQVYAALSQGIQDGYEHVGGAPAVAQWQRFNGVASQVMRTNQDLARKLLGPNQSVESLYSTLAGAAQAGGRANARLLLQAKGAITAKDPQLWNDFSASVINKLGQDNKGNFSPDIFLSSISNAKNGLSDVGKNILFTPAHQASLRDIAELAQRYSNLQKFANHSNTANNGSIAAFTAGLVTGPVRTITLALGANGVARLLARPAAAKAVSTWSHAYVAFAQQRSRQAAQLLKSQTKSFAAVVAREIGDNSQAPHIEDALINTRVTHEAPKGPQ